MNKTQYPIYVISRGRADTCLTADHFIKYGIEFYIVIEPQDELNYRKKYNNLVVMPENDQGIAYVRNFCIEYSKKLGYKYHWQVDDNIIDFKNRINNKNIKQNPYNNFLEIEKFINKYKNIGQAGFFHEGYAFSRKSSILINQQVYCCMCIFNNTGAKFEKYLPEDTDFSIQVLKNGFVTVLFKRLLILKTPVNSMKGGNKEIEYGNGGKEKRIDNLMLKYYPWFKKVIRPKGGASIKPSRIWSSFKQRPIPYE